MAQMRTPKPIVLGIGAIIAVIASASYALITHEPEIISKAHKPKADAHTASMQPNTAAISTDIAIEAAKSPEESFIWRKYSIKPGDSLSSIFAKLDLSHEEMNKIINTNKLGASLASIAAGKTLQIQTTPTGDLIQLVYDKNPFESLIATRQDTDFTVEKLTKEVRHEIVSTQFSKQQSLFLDGKNAGLSDNTIMQLTGIFGWDIDFALNIKSGDQITILYEKLFINDHEVGNGKIVAAEFVNQGKVYTAVKYEDASGHTQYYSPDGKRMQKAFLRTPVDFARISSHFSLGRKHPVLNRIRAHKGVDYAARTGTPVKCTADGKVVFRGWKGGYGRVVIVQHGKTYSTLYAHLSKFGKRLKPGTRVKQGQVIGYVGQSGLATGPHLHYELRVNGVHKNPLTVRLPNAAPLDKSLMADFKQKTQPLLSQLEKIKSVYLAKSDY